jgi:hypothetical protein
MQPITDSKISNEGYLVTDVVMLVVYRPDEAAPSTSSNDAEAKEVEVEDADTRT